MRIYAGIDEAGYGPLFGPLVVARSVFQLDDDDAAPADASADATQLAAPADLWQALRSAVCRTLAEQRKTGRLAINDSKKLHTKAGGIRHLEAGCLALASLAGRSCHGLDGWLTAMRGEPQTDAKPTTCPPWYAAADGQPAPTLPRTLTGEELAIAIAMLKRVSEQAAITCVDLGAEVIFEDRFNQMVAATRSKAAMSFTFVARHLQTIWQRFGKHHPFVAVDRQSGRTHYRQPLALSFPDVHLRILEEADHRSAYRLEQGDCRMTIVFQVDGESSHLPTAVASMTAKYTRELLMECFNAYFTRHVPAVKATAGYGTDGKRFWNDIQPHLAKLGIDGTQLRRCT